MGLYLPPELRWLGWIAGGAWPDGDETEVWHVSDAFKDTSSALNTLIPDIEDVKRLTISAYPEGTGGEKMGAAFDQMLTGDQSMESLAKFMEQISDAVFDFGTQIEAAKLMTIVSLIALAIEIFWAWMWPPTAAAEEAAEIAATQSILRRLELQLQERILAKVLSVFGEKFAGLSKSYILKILEAMLISGGLDAAVQLGQMAAGHRKHFDGKELGVSMLSSGVGAPFGRIGAEAIGKFTGKFLGNKLANPWIRTGNGAFVGIASSPIGGVAGNVATALATGDWEGTFNNPAGWVGGAARGGIVGGFHGWVGINGHNGRKSFEVPWDTDKDGSVHIPPRGGFSFESGGPDSNGPRGGQRAITFGENDSPETHPSTYPTRFSDSHGQTNGQNGGGNSSSRNGGGNDHPAVNLAGGGRNSNSPSESDPPKRTPGATNSTAVGSNSSGPGGSSQNRDVRPAIQDGSSSFQKPPAPEVQTPTRSAPPEVQTPARSTTPEVQPPTRPTTAEVQTPTRSTPPEVQTPARSTTPEVQPPTRPTTAEVQTPTRSTPPEVQTPARSTTPEVQTPTRSTPPEVQTPTRSTTPESHNPSGQSSPRASTPEPNPTGTPPQQRSSVPQSGPGSTSPQQRSSVPEPGSNPPGQSPRSSVPESNSNPSGQQRPVASSTGGTPPSQRPPVSETNPGGGVPRGAVPPEQHSDPGTQRGPDGAGQGGRGGESFEGGRRGTPNWIRNDRGEVLITSPDGTRHLVDRGGNILLGRPGDPTAVRIGRDRSVDFVPNDANHPAAQPSPRGNGASGPVRDGEVSFGRSDGTRHAVLSDGSVQTRSPDGSTTTIKRDGGVEFRSPSGERTRHEPDGTTIHTSAKGDTTVTTPDGKTHVVPNDRAGWERDADGNFVITSPDGTKHMIGQGGTMVVGRPGDPQFLRIGPDHSIGFIVPGELATAPRSGGTAGEGTGAHSPTFTRPDRVSHTVLPDGSVQTKAPDGWTTTVKSNGTTEFTSPTGDKTVFKSDGTVVESGPGKPTVTTTVDGTKHTADHNGTVTVENPDGSTHVVFDATDTQGGGRTRHADGTVIHHDLDGTLDIGLRDRLGGIPQDGPRKHGVIQMERPDGIGLESSPNGSKVFDANGTTYEAGSRGSTRITASNGETTFRSTTEPIELSNGAQLERTSGGFRVVHKDGSSSEIGPHGATFTDKGVVRGTRSDGTAFVRESDGTLREIRGDGAVRVTAPDQTAWGSRSDGTTWKVDDGGKIHVSDPDGTVAPPANPKNAWVGGGDEIAKARPRRLNDGAPVPEPYHAPTAPESEDWLPPGYDDTGGGKHSGPTGSDDDYDYDDQDYRGPGRDHYNDQTDDSGDGGGSGNDHRDSGGGSGGGDNGPDRSGDGPDNLGGGGDSGGQHGNSGGGGNSDHSGSSSNSPGGSDRSDSGSSGDGGSSGSDRTAPPEHRQPPPPPRPDPAELADMLQRLHSAEGMMLPPGDGGAFMPPNGFDGGHWPNEQGEQLPDFSRLSQLGDDSSQNPALLPDLSSLRGILDQLSDPGSDGSGQQGVDPGMGGNPGAMNDALSQFKSALQDQLSGLKPPGAESDSRIPGSGDRPNAHSGGSGSADRPNAPGSGNRSGGSGSEDHSGGSGSQDRSGSPGSGDRSSGPGSGDRPGSDGRTGGPGSEDHSGGTESDDRSNAPDSGAHSGDAGADDRSDGQGAEDHSGAPGSGERSGTEGSGDQSGAPGSEGDRDGSGTGDQRDASRADESHGAPEAKHDPAAPGQSKDPGQQGNSSQPGGSGAQHPATPGRPPLSPMQEGHQQAGAPPPPGGVPPGGGSSPTAPSMPGSKKKPDRRDRKKPDKDRKKPKPMLMPSPSDAPELAGPDDGVDIPFALGVPSQEVGPDMQARSTTKTTRSNADG
ncbi:hypothetical protein [Nocardia sp. NPDC051570]|uniref:WXG100-like domain-containing protein n=1 Tax=Nocardia sp. NPDC051570 TaxID=3364324 RepID=UPI0037A4F810